MKGCKRVKRGRCESSDADSELSNEKRVEIFEEIVPSGTDADGNEVSLALFLDSKFPHDDEGRRDAEKKISSDCESVAWQDYLAWFETKTGITRESSDALEDTDFMYEHVSGPSCVAYSGYNGSKITAEEMKYCGTVQCMARYDGYRHDQSQDCRAQEADDGELEHKGKYHLTGLGDRCGYWEDDCSVYPERHGMSEVSPMDLDGFDDGDPPFHPYCLETYRRVSTLRLGTDDLSGLAEWIDRRDSISGKIDSETPKHPAVNRGQEQCWAHNNGDEFLVAYPLHIPGLSSLLQSAKRFQQDFDAKSSPFAGLRSGSATSTDLFGRLPEEIRDMILVPLGSKDIASLRAASRTFRHLPYTVWHDLLKKEMPWIWEAWSDRPYPLMSCTTKQELMHHDETIENRKRAATELPRGARIVQEQLIAQDDTEFRKPRQVEQLDRLHTDWYYLYCQLRAEWKNIKGLQNRERIWKAAEFVVRRVQTPDEDLAIAEEEHWKVFTYQDLNSGG